MHGNIKQRWLELCEQAAVERNSDKLIEFVEELSRMQAQSKYLKKLAREQQYGMVRSVEASQNPSSSELIG